LERTLYSDVPLLTHLDPGLWLTRIDPGDIDSALINLAINARDAMPDGGTLVVETGNVCFETASIPEDVDLPSGDYAFLRVTDTGEGMAAHVRMRALEPFSRPRAMPMAPASG
jgi:signal transduction histidine kinase